jgi:hypothetical protein
MLIQKSQIEKGKALDYYILYYTFHNINIPFDCKTIGFALRGLGYQKNYLAMTLSRLVKCRFLAEPKLGIYCMTQDTFEILHTIDPELAQEIKSRLKYDKTVNCPKFS